MFSGPTSSTKSARRISSAGWSRAAQQQRPPGSPQPFGKNLERVQPGRIERRHVAQSQNHDRREYAQVLGRRFQLLRRAKQKRPVDPQDRHVFRNFLVLQTCDLPSRRYSGVTAATVVVSAMR
jgi:hypothetical protein